MGWILIVIAVAAFGYIIKKCVVDYYKSAMSQ